MTAICRNALLAWLISGMFAGSALAKPCDDIKPTSAAHDYRAAVYPFRPLAEQGDSSAQFKLARIYLNGEGVPQDYSEALRWYCKSAEEGYAPAQFFLGLLLRSGRELYGPGIPHDSAEALKWFHRAAAQGVANAMSNLGFIYRDGEGVTQDYVRAHMWFNLAVAASSADSRDIVAGYRDALAATMTPQQISEAQKLAREWKPK